LRKTSLPPGWHPQDPDEIVGFLSPFTGAAGVSPVRAAIAPHAGWLYSGKIAAKAIARLDRKIETIAIIGGHLPSGRQPLFAMESAVSTPLGRMEMDAELRSAMLMETGGLEDNIPGNTVEVILPMAHFFFPGASLLWMRLPDDPSSFDSGRRLAEAAERLGRSLAVVASADFTHYGRNYGFAPKGEGQQALRWVREVNDRRLIDAIKSGNPAETLERAREDRSSCSAGAVIGAMGFAQAAGLGSARLIEYGTSADAKCASMQRSFVSYAAFVFEAGKSAE